MSSVQSLSRLFFFKVSKLEYNKKTVCDFREIPRPHYCMGLLLRGRAVFVSGQERVEVSEGEIIFVPIGSCYISEWSGTPDVLDISLHFSFSPYGPFSREVKPKLQKLLPKNVSEYKQAFCQMLAWQTGSREQQLLALGLFYRVLGELFPCIQTQEIVKYDSRIMKAVDYIDNHYDGVVKGAELASIANMSESYFYNRFRAEMGMSPIEYKHRVCVDRAILLLIGEDNLSVEEISDRLGFESATYFRRVFRRLTGKSPMQYKKEVSQNG